MNTVIVLLQSIASACTKIEEGDEILYVDGRAVVSCSLQYPVITRYVSEYQLTMMLSRAFI